MANLKGTDDPLGRAPESEKNMKQPDQTFSHKRGTTGSDGRTNLSTASRYAESASLERNALTALQADVYDVIISS